MTQFGRTQLAVQRTLSDPALGNHFTAVTEGQRQSCLAAADRGLLRRDPIIPHRYYATELGWQALLEHEDMLDQRAAEKIKQPLLIPSCS